MAGSTSATGGRFRASGVSPRQGETPDQPNSGARGATLNRMRIPTSDGAGQRGTRRRGRGRANPGSDRDTAGPDAGRAAASRDTAGPDAGWRRAAGTHADSSRAGGSGLGPPVARTRTSSAQPGAGPASSGPAGGVSAGSSVFAPGYDSSRAGGDPAPARGGPPGSSSWYGSSAGGAVGKGPVRGYPPAPGQPPPMYPPGQFAAWNSGQDSRSRQGSQPGPQDGSEPNRGFPGGPRRDVSLADQTGQQAAQAAEARSRYYDSSGAEPGYSVLAVSDPAADVTTTQTWHAVADGRATGTWTAPALPGGQPGSQRTASGRHSAPPGATRPVVASPDAGLARLEPATGAAPPDTERRDRSGRDGDRQDGGQRPKAGPSAANRSGAHTSPHAAVSASPGPEAKPRPAPRGKSPASGKRPASRKRPASVKLAISVAVLLVVVAAGTLAYTVLRTAPKPTPPAAAPPAQPTVTPSASSSPSLGPYGHIASRQSDPEPLTIAQLFPASFKMGGTAVTLAASWISRHCGRAIAGSNLQSAVSSAGCDQAARATYVATKQGVMGTVGVLNLSTAAKAAKAAKATDGGDFISQLKGKRGPARKIGNGTGIEEALAKGHYLILIWAEFTSLRKPKTAAQRSRVEAFMQDLLQSTANLSLTNRMLNGSP
jgi:hypothetical protein